MNTNHKTCACGGPTSLYRHYDAHGNLLYVGISKSVPTRLARHFSTSHWAGNIQRVDVEHWGTRIEALAAEKTAIRAENPKWNIHHNQTPKSNYPVEVDIGPSVYMSSKLARAYPGIDLAQRRIVLLGMSKLSARSSNRTVVFSFTEYSETFLENGPLSHYKSFKQSVEDLAGKFAYYNPLDVMEGEPAYCRWVEDCRWYKENAALWVEITFSDEIDSHCGITPTAIPLKTFKGVKSLYAFKLAELIFAQGLESKTVNVRMAELHHATGATEAYTKNSRDFLRRCLNPLVEEINYPEGKRLKISKKMDGKRIGRISFRLVR